MATEEVKREVEAVPAPVPPPAAVEAPAVVAEEKAVVVAPLPPPAEEKVDESKALVVADKLPDPPAKSTSASLDRDIALAEVEKEKRLSFIKAWEESEKSKVENKAQKKLSGVTTWENSKKAALEAKLKQVEEDIEKKKSQYAEKIQNKIAMVHKQAEENRAMVEARRGEDLLKAEELAAKFRATSTVPKKALGFLGL